MGDTIDTDTAGATQADPDGPPAPPASPPRPDMHPANDLIVSAVLPRAVLRCSLTSIWLWLVPVLILFSAPSWAGPLVSMAGLSTTDVFSVTSTIAGLLAIRPIAIVVWRALFEGGVREGALEDNPTPLECVFKAQSAATPPIGGSNAILWDWHALRRRLRDAGLPTPRTVASHDLRDALRAIPLTPHFIEPEPIRPRGPTAGMRATLVAILGLVALWSLITGHTLVAAIVTGLAFAVAVRSRLLRDLLRPLSLIDNSLFIGQGSVRDHRGQTWTTDDAMIVVRSASPLEVILTGRAGVRTLRFTDVTDPDFVRLWRAWNHPDPRPELVGCADDAGAQPMG